MGSKYPDVRYVCFLHFESQLFMLGVDISDLGTWTRRAQLTAPSKFHFVNPEPQGYPRRNPDLALS